MPYIVIGIHFKVYKLTRLQPDKYLGDYVFQIETKTSFVNGYWNTQVFHNSQYLDEFQGIPLVLYITKDYVPVPATVPSIQPKLYLSEILGKLNNFTQN